jgi:hypothetical protein
MKRRGVTVLAQTRPGLPLRLRTTGCDEQRGQRILEAAAMSVHLWVGPGILSVSVVWADWSLGRHPCGGRHFVGFASCLGGDDENRCCR